MNSVVRHKAGGEVKPRVKAQLQTDNVQGSGVVEGYLVTWGNDRDTDLQGEFFTARTEFCLDWFGERPVLYHHGLDGSTGLRKIGMIKSMEQDDLGLWVKAQLDLRDRYGTAVYDMVKSSEFGWSSGSVDHLVKIAPNGEIAVWPLIEGSITPTPAQPAKTTVRAMKARGNNLGNIVVPNVSLAAIKSVLANDSDKFISDYLRELDARVEFAEELLSEAKASDGSRIKSYGVKARGGSMASESAKRLAQAYAKSYGIRATQGELDRVAQKAEEAVAEEMSLIAPEDSETLDVLEQEMTGEVAPATASMRRASARRRSLARRSAADANSGLTDVDSIAEKMASEIIDDMEQEIKSNMNSNDLDMEVKRVLRAKRAARAASRSRRSAYRTEGLDDVGASFINDTGIEAGGGGDLGYLGDEASKSAIRRARVMRAARRAAARSATRSRSAVRSGSRARRGYSYREGEEAALPPVAPAIPEEEILATEVAAASYRRGARAMARSLLSVRSDTIGADVPMIREDSNEVGVYSGGGGETTTTRSYLARRAAARRNSSRRGAYRGEEAAAEIIEGTMNANGLGAVATASKRAALRRMARSRRGAYRGEEGMPAEAFETPAQEFAEQAPAIAGYRRRSTRTGGRGSEFDAAMASDPMADDLIGTEATASFNGRRSFRGKSMENGNDANYWKRRAIKAEMMEAPGQRKFGDARVTRDSADQSGAYNRAFKSYLRQGLGMLSDTEKYTLKAKGASDFGRGSRGTFGFDGNGSIKTYYGGSDSSAGFLVPPDWIAEMNKNIMTQTVMAAECRTRTTTSDRVIQPNLVTTDARRGHADSTVRWPGESPANQAASLSTADTFSQIEVPIHVMLMNFSATNTALEDSSFSLEDMINEKFSEDVAIAYDELIYAGDGIGKLEGIVTNNKVVGSASTGVATVGGYIASGSVDGIINGDVIQKMFMHLPRQYRSKAKWYMNSDTALQIATLKNGNGDYLINQRDEGLRSIGAPETLMGRPIVYNDFASDIATNSYPILFGDLTNGYLVAKRVDFSIRRFDDSAQALNDNVLFIGRARIGGQVLQPAAMKVLKIAAS